MGLTHFANKSHLARAVLEATAFQTADVLAAAGEDLGVRPSALRVDGGMTANALLMQFQADVLGLDVVRPRVPETTSLGAAYVAGLAVGYWGSLDELRQNWREDVRWSPTMPREDADRLLRTWHKAVTRTYGWLDDDAE